VAKQHLHGWTAEISSAISCPFALPLYMHPPLHGTARLAAAMRTNANGRLHNTDGHACQGHTYVLGSCTLHCSAVLRQCCCPPTMGTASALTTLDRVMELMWRQ
jgi:hypothetical protein